MFLVMTYVTRGGLKMDELLFVHGASGSLGIAAIQVARDRSDKFFFFLNRGPFCIIMPTIPSQQILHLIHREVTLNPTRVRITIEIYLQLLLGNYIIQTTTIPRSFSRTIYRANFIMLLSKLRKGRILLSLILLLLFTLNHVVRVITFVLFIFFRLLRYQFLKCGFILSRLFYLKITK